MFCEECGAKNKNGAAFCEECGHKFKVAKEAKVSEKVSETPKNETKPAKEKTPMSKGKKILIGCILVVVAALVAGYMFVSNSLKPDKIALKYFKAYANKDADKLCDVISLNDSEFVSKKLIKESFKNEEKIKLANYSVEKTEKSTNGLSARVTIKYVEDGSSKEKTQTVKLTKNKNKKYLFFDNWVVDSSELIVEDYNISVPKDAKVSINGVEIKDKYKNDSSSSYYDSYTIPSILKGEYEIVADLTSGIKLSGKSTIKNSYSSFASSSLKLEKKTEESLVKDIKEKVKAIYDAVMDDKSFDDIKDKFNDDYADDIEYVYDNIKRYVMTDYNKLTEFDITDIKINSYSIYEDKIKFTVQMKYNYKIEYKSGDDTKDYSKKDKSDIFYVDYKLDKKELELSGISSLVSYFSHYGY